MHHFCVISLAILLTFVGVSANNGEPCLDDFDPFKILAPDSKSAKSTSKNTPKENPYKPKQIWRHFFYGDMTVSVGEYFSKTEQQKQRASQYYTSESFKKTAGCKRVFVFSVRGLVLLEDVVKRKDCQDSILTPQIMYLDNVLWYYPDMRIKPDTSGKQFVLVKLTNDNNGKLICQKRYIDFNQYKSGVEHTETVDLQTATDEDCKALKLGETGSFPVSSIDTGNKDVRLDWGDGFSIIIQNEPYLVIKFWKYTMPFCHWQLVVYLNGHPLTGTRIFCGDSLFRDIAVTEKGLYVGKHIIARLSPAGKTEATVLLNPRNGKCVKEQYRIKTVQDEGKSKSFGEQKSITTLHEPDQECKDFIEGKLTEKQMNRDKIESVIKHLEDKKFNAIPLLMLFKINDHISGPLLLCENTYVPEDVNAHVSNGNGMDVLVIENISKTRWLVLVAKGVIIDVARINTIPTFYVTPLTIMMDKLLSIERDKKDENLFTVTSFWSGNVCTRTRYVVVNDKDGLRRQELFPAEIGLSGEECSILSGLEKTEIGEKYTLPTLKDYTQTDLAEFLS